MRARPSSRVLGCFALTALICRGASSDPVDFFKNRVRPVLVSNCYTCHTNLKMGGLELDSLDHILKGGNSGPAVVPGNAQQSRLIRAVSYVDERLKMPPQGKLS